VDVEAPLESGQLGGDANRAAPSVAVMAETGLRSELPVVTPGIVIAAVLPVGRTVAAERDKRGDADRDRVRAECERLGGVGAGTDAARHHELDLALHPDVAQRLSRQPDRREGGDAGVL